MDRPSDSPSLDFQTQGIDALVKARYSILVYPRGMRRSDVVTKVTKTLEIYRVVLDPTDPETLLNPEIDFIIFSGSVTITGEICPGGAVVVLSTWGDKPITDSRFKTFKYIEGQDLEVEWDVVPVSLTQQQMLYYDHLSASKAVDKLHAVSLFVGSHEMMTEYIKGQKTTISPGPTVLPLGAKISDHSGKIASLDLKIKDNDLVFTAHPHLVDSFLHPCRRTLISGTDGREFTTSQIHLLDSWSVSKIRDLLSVVRPSEKLKLVLYIGHHPHTNSVDAIAYEDLFAKLGEIDLLYSRGRSSSIVRLDID